MNEQKQSYKAEKIGFNEYRLYRKDPFAELGTIKRHYGDKVWSFVSVLHPKFVDPVRGSVETKAAAFRVLISLSK